MMILKFKKPDLLQLYIFSFIRGLAARNATASGVRGGVQKKVIVLGGGGCRREGAWCPGTTFGQKTFLYDFALI